MPIFTPNISTDTTVGLTDAELRATPVPISGTITATPTGTQDVSLVSTIPVPVTGTFFQATQPISGTVSVSGSVTATGPLTDAELRATPVPISGSVSTTPLSATSSTISQITSTGSNQTLLAANANRKKAIFFFNSGIWNLKLGIGASATSRTYNISSANTTIEVAVWTGQIDVSCTTAGKLVDVTELS